MDFGALNFAISQGTSPRTLAARFGDILTPYDFNPTGLDLGGDGPDAGPAIQAMFDEAFGPDGAAHGADAGYLNKPCYIPKGIYRTEQQLHITHVDGAWLFGDGMDATKIVQHGVGTGPGGALWTLYVKWGRNCLFEGFTISGPPTAAEPYTGAPVACGFIGGDGVYANNAGNHNIFLNMGFERGVDGMFPGWLATGLGSEFCFINCRMRDCRWGYRVAENNNAIDHSLYGGTVENCLEGVSAVGGGFNIILGTRFINNTYNGGGFGMGWDIYQHWADPTTIIGVTSNSTGRNIAVGGQGYIADSNFVSTDRFLDVEGGSAIIENNKTAGTVMGTGRLYTRANDASHADFLDDFAGTNPEAY